MEQKKFSIKARLASFKFAAQGFIYFLRGQHNAILHVLATVTVFLLAWIQHLPAEKWLWLVLAVCLVWAAELVNTAIELLCDLINPAYDKRIKYIKDLAAAAVLICAITALIIGLIIFYPTFYHDTSSNPKAFIRNFFADYPPLGLAVRLGDS
jgi:diacylglycerol kinase (ATP)